LQSLHAATRGVQDLPDGYLFQLGNQGSLVRDVAEYITLERLCCPFFDFELRSNREDGAITLRLTGREGVKEFAKLEFNATNVQNSGIQISTKESPLACNDATLNPAQLQRLGALVTQFRSSRQEVRELPDGYAIRLPSEGATLRDVADYMALVRSCSPYFETALRVECEGGPAWLSITGRAGVKPLAKEELTN
jgi:hypothetical protein